MRTSTRAGLAATVAAGAAAALLVLWNPTATAGTGGHTAPTEPAPVAVAGGNGTDQGPAPSVPNVDEPVAPSRAPVPKGGASPDPDTPVSSPALPYDPGYWTPERMASAKPIPMPSPR